MAKVVKNALKAGFRVALTVFVATVFFVGTAWAMAYAGMAASLTFFSNVITGLTTKGIEATSRNFGAKITGKGAQVPRQIVYGKCRIGGTIVKMRTTGTDNNKLHLAIVLAGHEIESLEGVYFHDKLLNTTSSTISGETVFRVTNNDFTNTDNENAIVESDGTLVQFTFHDGGSSDNASVDGLASANAASSYPSTAKFTGMAYVYMEIIYDPEKIPQIPPIWFEVKGKKVYDPRNSTTAWSDNPALIARDFLVDTTYGLRCLSNEINDSTNAGGFAAAANTCDALQTLSDNSSTEKSYTANGFSNMGADGEGILEGVLSACAGKITYTNGKFNIFVGAAQTPSLTLTDDQVLEAKQISTKSIQGDLYNGVKALYVDASNKYQGVEAPILVDSTALSEDTPSGEQTANYRKIQEIQLPFTVTDTMAQRLQKIHLKRHRETTTISVLATLEFLRLQPSDWLNVTNSRLSYSSKTFEVISTQLEFIESEGNRFAATRLILREINSAVYSYQYNEYTAPQATAATPEGGDLSIKVPTAGTLSQRNRTEGSTTKVDLLVPWTNHLDPAIQGTEVQYKESGESTYSTATVTARGQTQGVINNVNVATVYNVRIRHFSFDNVFSDFVNFSAFTVSEPNTIDAPTGLSVTNDKPFVIEISYTNPARENFRSVEIYYGTSSSFTPASTNLIGTYYGEPAKKKIVSVGVAQGLTYDQNYYFKLRGVNQYGSVSSYITSGAGKFKKAQNTDVENLNASAITAGTINTDFLDVSDIISTGNIITDSATIGNDIRIGSGESVFSADSAGIYLGNETFANAEFRVTPAGALTATNATITGGSLSGLTLTGTKISQGSTSTHGSSSTNFYLDNTGDFSLQDKLVFDSSASALTLAGQLNATTITVGSGANTAAMQSTGDVRFWAGSANPTATTPFVVEKNGEVFARNLVLTDANGNEYFNAADGFTDLAFTQVVSTIDGAKITTYSEALSSDSDEIEVAFEQQSNVTFRAKLNASFRGFDTNSNQTTAETNARADIPDNFTIMLRYHSSSGFSSSQGTLIATQTYTKVASGVTPTATQYALTTVSFFDQELNEHNATSGVNRDDAGAPNASGFVILEQTVANFPSGTSYIKAFISTTDTNYDTTNKVTSTASRTVDIQDNTTDGGFTIDGGVGQSVGAADITSVAITANDGISGGGTQASGAAAFTLGLGDITPDNVTTGNLTVTGDLTITGDLNSYNVTDLDVQDKTITVNAGGTEAGSDESGLVIDRGLATDASFKWDEPNERFELTHSLKLPAGGQVIVSADDYLDFDDDSQAITNGTNATVLSSVSDVAIRTNANDGGGGLFRVVTGEDNNITEMMSVTTAGVASFAGTVAWQGGGSGNANTAYSHKPNSLAFNTGNGVLTLTRQNGTTLTADLDGRYLYTSTANVITGAVQLKTEAPTTANTLLFLNANDQFADIIASDDDGSVVYRNNRGAFQLFVDGTANSSATNNAQLALTVATNKQATFASTVAWTGGSSSNANTAYTYSQVGHVPLAGGTMTGDLTIQKTTPRILLKDNNGSQSSYPEIEFETNNNQGVKLYHTEFDGELPATGYGLVLAESDTNTQFPNTGTLSFNVLGEMYAGATTLGSLNKVFHDGYHPNADQWTDAIQVSIELTGDVTGGPVTANVDGSGDVTFQISTTGGGVIDTITNFADNRVITATDADSLNGEANLTFDGTTLSAPRARLSGTADLSLSSTTHGFQIGATTGANLAMDVNEVMARSNGSTASLNLNADGGTIEINANKNARVSLHGGDTGAVVLIRGAADEDATLKLQEAGSGDVGAHFFYDGGANKLRIKTGNNPPVTRMTFLRDSTAVGIGQDDPTAALDVNGSIKFSSALKQGSSDIVNASGVLANVTANANIITSGTFSDARISRTFGRKVFSATSSTESNRWVSFTIPFLSGQNSSRYYAFEVLGHRDIATMDSYVNYRVYVHIRSNGTTTNSIKVKVIELTKGSNESFTFGYKQVASTSNIVYTVFGEDYSDAHFLSLTDGTNREEEVLGSMFGTTTTDPTGITSVDVRSFLTNQDAITTAGAITAGGASSSLGYYVGGAQVIDGNRNFLNALTVRVADGTQAAPSIRFTSDGNTGLYRENDDELRIVTGGAWRAYFSSAGIFSSANVYTGTTGDFRNFGGEWHATTGTSGNGFKFTNTADSVDALVITATGNGTFAGSLSATTKSFDIPHPTKDGMRLHHGSLEGPEHGVYARGRASGGVIELPDYWEGLVDENSLTVVLTPLGRFQRLYVVKVEQNKVYIKNGSWFSSKIDCFYTIQARRKDVEQFEVEYAV